ncbi:hypothetical protein LshimejAT787_0904290 [Lyophyllum shimeji]|uniref:Uncharacterized protein n=1 Tax=Lyophyllum shimeji TaxID=47721 RepID=A0A9P3UN48_LYOSH|nr:hypothetical protein LshimejAT787_0904290 [Lyophyllum shimeji]
MYSTRRTSGSHPLIPPDPALPPPASVLPPPASVLVPPDSSFLHRRIPDSRLIVAPRAPHITIQFLQGKGSLDLFSLDLPLPASSRMSRPHFEEVNWSRAQINVPPFILPRLLLLPQAQNGLLGRRHLRPRRHRRPDQSKLSPSQATFDQTTTHIVSVNSRAKTVARPTLD